MQDDDLSVRKTAFDFFLATTHTLRYDSPTAQPGTAMTVQGDES
jgi:hypothetical protein